MKTEPILNPILFEITADRAINLIEFTEVKFQIFSGTDRPTPLREYFGSDSLAKVWLCLHQFKQWKFPRAWVKKITTHYKPSIKVIVPEVLELPENGFLRW